MLFGVKIEGRSIHVESAEEDRGRTCYSIALEVGELDLEIEDQAR